MTEELVVLLDEKSIELGTIPKKDVHGPQTPLHKAFSCFLFNSKGEILLQQRSHKKKTWPLVWSNSVCGHPQPHEFHEQAVKRRFKEELGMDVEWVQFISQYRYCFVRYEVMENEICPIFIAFSDQAPQPNPDEVESVRWMTWEDYVTDTKQNPQNWSEWCVEEVAILNSTTSFRLWLEGISTSVRK